ncbi:hypothetical protein [Paractinoplanes rishiriensis]|uniref:hypothetical protein n=1 Tax=Paractinoplanes rishiriensis TaxID=1050105 RepID=UPI0019427937|nr:hypothetical protein [Actinoplanes rishiriensis]
MEPTDAELVEAAQRGDRAAAEALLPAICHSPTTWWGVRAEALAEKVSLPGRPAVIGPWCIGRVGRVFRSELAQAGLKTRSWPACAGICGHGHDFDRNSLSGTGRSVRTAGPIGVVNRPQRVAVRH